MTPIRSIDDWTKALEESRCGPVVVYKHREGCPACDEKHTDIREAVELGEIRSSVYIVTTPADRAIAERIASDLLIEHKTPQAIIVVNRRASFVADQLDIEAAKLAEMLERIGEAYRELREL